MAIVRHIKNNDPYRYLGENKYRNLRTGNEGVIDEEKAREVLKINIEATAIINEYPEVEAMIKTLGLKFEKND